MSHDSYYANRVAIVFGGASGLGAALCRELRRQGATVVVADINAPLAESLAVAIGATFEAVDVRDASAVDAVVNRAVERFGRLDLVINSAGVIASGPILQFSPEEWQRVLDVNLGGCIHSSLAAYRVMRQQQNGHIVNIGSLSGIVPTPLFAPYTTSKSALTGFSLALADEASRSGVATTLVCPGNLRTAMIGDESKSWLTPLMDVDRAAARILRELPKGARMLVFPSYARVMWWMQRSYPSLIAMGNRFILRHAPR